jgi:ribosome-binding protein aMBF1 (putative translation factor)
MRFLRGTYSEHKARARSWAVGTGLMTPGECRIARERLGWTRERLGAASETNSEVIRAYESSGVIREARNGSETGVARLAKVQRALQDAGAVFASISPPPSGVWITPAQCNEARKLLGWTLKRLAREVGFNANAIGTFEKTGRIPDPIWGDQDRLSALRRTFETAGVEFMDEQKAVRLRAYASPRS